MEKSFDRQVEEALEKFNKGWASIQEYIKFVEDNVEIPADFVRGATRNQLAAIVRRKVKQQRDADGLAKYESIEVQDEEGETSRVYKQLDLFSKEDFRQAIGQHTEKAYYFARLSNSLTLRGNKQTGTRRQLPFPGFGLLASEDKKAV